MADQPNEQDDNPYRSPDTPIEHLRKAPLAVRFAVGLAAVIGGVVAGVATFFASCTAGFSIMSAGGPSSASTGVLMVVGLLVALASIPLGIYAGGRASRAIWSHAKSQEEEP